ncbi:MAG TPA: helix-turn-helix transcriptional regulator, partial [Chloroflexota bacterium]|nr:helix-turn-helix transcriptional regulator [Chloroflexota bacterium]
MTTDPPAAFGTLLKRYRVAAGLTQEELAERSGLSVRGISDLERGRRSHPYHGTIRLLADTLGLTEEERSVLSATARPGAGATVPATTADPPSNLPNPVTSFIGREDDRRAVCQLLDSSEVRLINLTSPGEVGKTRLALRVAAEARRSYSDG